VNKKTETRIILGAPYVFSRKHLRKPKHTEVVKMRVRGVICHNACGLYFVAPNADDMKTNDVCPSCSSPPQCGQIAREPEEIAVLVHMAFGNCIDVEYLRTFGTLARKHVEIVSSPYSNAHVLPGKN